MKSRSIPLAALTTFLIAGPASATVILTDNFNTWTGGKASNFNASNALAADQGGSLATITYNVQGSDYVLQRGNGGRLLVANDNSGQFGYGNVSLAYNFATQANSYNGPLTISFNITNVTGYTDTSRWVQFNLGSAQNLDVANGAATVGVLFRQFGQADVLNNGNGLAGGVNWSPNDLVTITLSDTAGTGSAFNGNGSKATISIGNTSLGPFTLAQQSAAYLTFSAFNYSNDQFGLGTFDNLSVAIVPEPGAALMGGLGTLALLRRRRPR